VGDIHLPEKEVSDLDLNEEKGKSARLTGRENEIVMVSFSIITTQSNELHLCCLYRKLA
jgi:hypothetical protein